MDELPRWPQGTVAVLSVAGPHAIAVSTAVRAGDHRILFALGRRRDALRRLRDDPNAALCMLAEGMAFTACGRARVVADQLAATDTVVAVELRVERIQDHLADGRTEMLDGARWRWADEEAAAMDPEIVAELRRLAAQPAA